MNLTREQQRDLLTRTLARAIERHQAGEMSPGEIWIITAGTLAALDLLIPRPANVHLN